MRSLLLFSLSVPLLAGVADHPDVTASQRLFDAWLRGQIAYRGLPGIAVGVVHDQELLWAKGYGFADVEKKTPVTPATQFRMASHSKLFTATAIMQLRDKGKLRLDDPVQRYLPWFQPKPAEPDDPPITIEELLTHSSGLPREAGSHWSTQEFPDADGVKRYILSHGAPYSPEVRWKYSNLALTIAGMIVETVSGEPFNDYIARHIFVPLGMTGSSIDRNVDSLAIGYGRRMPDGSRQKFAFIHSRAMSPATGVTSNIEDMAKFVSLQFRKGKPGGAQILSTGALREMHRVRRLENDWTRGNAIGFAVNREKDKVYIGHGGSYPGYKTHTYIDIAAKVGVIVLTNGDDAVPADIAMKLMQTVGEAVAKAGAPQTPKPDWDPRWTRFTGLYRSRGGDTEVVALNQKLVLIDPTSANITQSTLTPLGNDRFRLDAPTGGSAVGEIVRFLETGGKVTRMFLGDSFTNRVNP
ncbi:MAG: beta-lactamase family protein [Bryobacterales bacterium]|nr:beta-lactamase family protein [Bryobacterales bacterium]